MLPQLLAIKDRTLLSNTFGGINKNVKITYSGLKTLAVEDTEFADMQNMTLDHYPIITTRSKRGVITTLTKPQGVLGGDVLSYVDNNKFYYNSSKVLDLSNEYDERQLVYMGAYICIFPDGIVYNSYTNETSYIKNEFTSTTDVTLRMCKFSGEEFDDTKTFIGKDEPSDKTSYPYWLDTSSDPAILKMWSANYSMWTSVGTTYVKISATGIGSGLHEYDSVKLSGITVKGYNDQDFNDTYIVYKVTSNSILIAGLLDKHYTITTPVKVKREFPEMDFVCELDNRIWGCSSANHEIYACKQGSPWNWNSYAGLDSDSYAATVGSQGDFTGAVAYGGYVFFFKEDGFHKLYGTKPSNFEMVWKPCRGVQKGCHKSIAIVNEILFFKSRDAIVAYDGSQSTISTKLGVEPFYNAVAVGYRNKYYISMRDSSYKYRLYVYDITKGAWTIEDDIRLKYAVYANNGTYLIDFNNRMYVVNNEKIYTKYFPSMDDAYFRYPSATLYAGDLMEGTLEDEFEYSLTTCDMGLELPYEKYVKRVNLRMELSQGSSLKIDIMYDSDDVWEHVMDFVATKKRSYDIPIVPRRADHMKIRFSGIGTFKLISYTKTIELGTDEERS